MKTLSFWEVLGHSLTGWRNFRYPSNPTLPRKPWHPDGDAAFTSIPSARHPKSDEMIAHLHTTGPLYFGTGSTQPSTMYQGVVDGYFLNKAESTHRVFEISRTFGPGKIWVSTGYNSSYGAKLRYSADAMIHEGEPARSYSDNKVHIFDNVDLDIGPKITELQYLDPNYTGSSLICHGATQYSLDLPSTHFNVRGQSAAKYPLAELVLRYDDIVQNNWVQRTTMTLKAGSSSFIYPALGSDGPSTHPSATPFGAVLRLKRSVSDHLAIRGITRQTNPQAFAVMDCYMGPGLIVVDTGGRSATNLEPDNRWNQRDLSILKGLTWDDFEIWTL
jgi:hypothetical protein